MTEALILLLLGCPMWHLLWISRQSGHSYLRSAAIVSCAVIWSVWSFLAVKTGFDREWFGSASAARPLTYLAVVSIIAWTARNFLVGPNVSQHLLIGLQIIRPIGMVFVLETSLGNLPGVFSYPAGFGDLAVGLTALYVVFRYRGSSVPPSAVRLVAALGLIDFASAFFFGFTSSATPVQLFAFDNPNTVIEYPTGLIPLFLVPYAVAAHTWSLVQLRRDQRSKACQQPGEPRSAA
jgi:hypothetical protein